MRTSFWIRAAGVLAAFGIAVGAPCMAAGAPASEPGVDGPYAPYAFLIGEWNVAPESGGDGNAIAWFRWGPGHSYIWYAVSFVANGAEEPHFEGLLLWNGVHKNLDMLLSLDLHGGKVQEQGTVSANADGTVVRDITAYYSEGIGMITTGRPAGPGGETARFRQTFKAAAGDRILTALLREKDGAWIPTFPGSDRLAMTRRASS